MCMEASVLMRAYLGKLCTIYDDIRRYALGGINFGDLAVTVTVTIPEA